MFYLKKYCCYLVPRVSHLTALGSVWVTCGISQINKYQVQSLNSPFFPPHIGAESGRAKRESRITSMRRLKTPPFPPPPPQIGGKTIFGSTFQIWLVARFSEYVTSENSKINNFELLPWGKSVFLNICLLVCFQLCSLLYFKNRAVWICADFCHSACSDICIVSG